MAKACRSAGKTEKSQGKEPPAVSSYSNCFVSPLQEENNGSEYSNYLIVDTGSTDHIINQNNVFENLRPCNEKSVRDPKGNLTPANNGPVKGWKDGRNGPKKCSLCTKL